MLDLTQKLFQVLKKWLGETSGGLQNAKNMKFFLISQITFQPLKSIQSQCFPRGLN